MLIGFSGDPVGSVHGLDADVVIGREALPVDVDLRADRTRDEHPLALGSSLESGTNYGFGLPPQVPCEHIVSEAHMWTSLEVGPIL